jgi:hypothetical protein
MTYGLGSLPDGVLDFFEFKIDHGAIAFLDFVDGHGFFNVRQIGSKSIV